MEVALQQLPIIRCVFSFLYPDDLHRYRLVCKLWHKQALQLLQKCPPIDECLLIKENVRMQMETLCGRGEHQALENLESKGLKTTPSSNHNRWVEPTWWFLMREKDCETSTKLNVEECLKSFVEGNLKCFPSFSLLSFSILEQLPEMTPRYPTVLLPQTYLWVADSVKLKIYETLDKLANETNLFRTLMDESSFWYQDQSKHGYIYGPDVLFHGIHINRYISNHKVIITDWLQPSSPKPNLTDNEFPIKSLIYFVSLEGHKRMIEQFVEGSSFDVSSKFTGLGNTIFYHDPSFVGFRSTVAISIAFAGKQIRSSTWEIKLDEDLSFDEIYTQFNSFREQLEFSYEDNRTLGFLFGTWKNQSQFASLLGTAEIIVNELFPCIKYVHFGSDQGGEKFFVRLHLIRI